MNKYYGNDYITYLKNIKGIEQLINEKERIKQEYVEGNITSKQRDFFTRLVNQKIKMINEIVFHDQHLTLMMMQDEGYDPYTNMMEIGG